MNFRAICDVKLGLECLDRVWSKFLPNCMNMMVFLRFICCLWF